MDFTFNNINIKNYFETGENPPISELEYLHSHPLVRPNFILQLEDQILRLQERTTMGNPAPKKATEELIEAAIIIGSVIPHLKDEKAVQAVLEAMRTCYRVCNSLGIEIKPA